MIHKKTRADWKEAAKNARRLAAAVSSRTVQFASKCHAVVSAIEPWGILVALLGVGIVLVSILVDLEDRQSERTFRAWQLVLNAPLAGSSRWEAIEYLNREFDGFLCGNPMEWLSSLLTGNSGRMCVFPSKARESLSAIDLAGANLTNADLTEADVSYANLAGVNFTDANLTGADFTGADFTGAILTGAVLDSAVLVVASLEDALLEGADLTDADLTGADFTNADLTGADLTGASLSQAQLDAACGFAFPQDIPQELTWRSTICPILVQ